MDKLSWIKNYVKEKNYIYTVNLHNEFMIDFVYDIFHNNVEYNETMLNNATDIEKGSY